MAICCCFFEKRDSLPYTCRCIKDIELLCQFELLVSTEQVSVLVPSIKILALSIPSALMLEAFSPLSSAHFGGLELVLSMWRCTGESHNHKVMQRYRDSLTWVFTLAGGGEWERGNWE
mmetsp:Transcript_11742/g.31630  ORF Transcript_11742/g.31630 Transcript_11742/m.31630 type:complete len:118 (+) Transcript_11742:2466-2819(+)